MGEPSFVVTKYGGTWRLTEAGWEYVAPCNVQEPERPGRHVAAARAACGYEAGHEGPHSWEGR